MSEEQESYFLERLKVLFGSNGCCEAPQPSTAATRDSGLSNGPAAKCPGPKLRVSASHGISQILQNSSTGKEPL